MSYSTINGMRSQRYPLMGGRPSESCGCGSYHSVGSAPSVETGIWIGTALGVGILAVGAFALLVPRS